MPKLMLLAFACFLTAATHPQIEVVSISEPPHYETPVKAAFDFPYEKSSPFDLLAMLIRQDERGRTTFDIADAPQGWIVKRDIRLLLMLLDSDQPCAGVHSTRDSSFQFGRDTQPGSTVGHEAGYMILSYIHGLYPKGAKYSSDWEVEPEEIRRLWKERKEE